MYTYMLRFQRASYSEDDDEEEESSETVYYPSNNGIPENLSGLVSLF